MCAREGVGFVGRWGEGRRRAEPRVQKKDEGVLTGTLDHVEQEQRFPTFFFPSFEWNTSKSRKRRQVLDTVRLSVLVFFLFFSKHPK